HFLQIIQQLSHRIKQIEHSNKHSLKSVPPRTMHPGTRTQIIGTTQTTTIRPGTDLVQHYPAIPEQNFYAAKLADNYKFYNLSDYHYTEGMVYKASVLDHAKVSLSPAAKKHDADLAAIQTRMAHHTRFYNSFACDILENSWENSKQGKVMLQFLNTMRIAAGNDAAKISQMRFKLYYTALRTKHEPAVARKAASDLIRTTQKDSDSGRSGWQQRSSGSNNDKSNDQSSSSFKKKKKYNKQGSNGNSNSSGNW
ncbi:hypothetical protein BGZ47_001118, partial [Haplosporangium gracile]